jgi:biotin carboxylase
VVKLARGAGSKLLSFVRNEAELERAYGRLPADPSNAVFDYDRPLLQRHVEGAVHDADALCSRGEVRAGFTKRRALTTGRGRGVTFEAELTAEPDLLDLAARLLGELRWHGPASVEFIRDQRDGTPWLLEVNPRFGGAMAAGIAAGVDLPVMACRLALEGDVARAAVSEPGLRYRWPIPLGAMHVWSSRPRRAALRGLIDPPPGTRTDLRLDDPMPHIVQTLQLIPAWIDHRLRRRARHR